MDTGKKKDLRLYWSSFTAFAVAITIITTVIILVNTYSPLQSKNVLSEALKNSSELSDSLYDIQEHFNESARIMTYYLPESNDPLKDVDFLQKLITSVRAVSTDFTRQREFALGYFFCINAEIATSETEVFHNIETGTQSHISMILGYMTDTERRTLEADLQAAGKPVWTTINQPMVNKYYLSCVAPLFINSEYIGFVGLVIDTSVLKDAFSEIKSQEWRFSFLLSANNEIFAHDYIAGGERLAFAGSKRFAALSNEVLVKDSGYMIIKEPMDSKMWIYAFSKMPSGHTYVEAQQRNYRVKETNLLIMQIALIAIIATSLVEGRSGEDSFFDWISSRVIKAAGGVHPIFVNSRRAVLALHIGSIGGVGSRLLFLFLSGSSVLLKFFCAVLLGMLLYSLRLYSVGNTKMRRTAFIILMTLLVPVVAQIIGNGVDSYNIIWILVAVVGALFLTEYDVARNVFYAFVITLFLYTLFEIFFLENPRPQSLVPIISSLFFLGFAMFSAVGLFERSSKKDFLVIEDTLKRLKDAQSLLVQHEKMVTLGTLIAGIAHEINTPLGAIKASAETMSASLEHVFRTLMIEGRDFDEHDFEDFFNLVEMTVTSINEINPTSLARKARPEIRTFVKNLNHIESEDIAAYLIQLEICNMNLLMEREESLLNPKAAQMLKIICDISPVTTGSWAIRHAVTKAGKIVFALRSYSHSGVLSDASGVNASFDIVQSIENVLILYQNQLKHNVEVVRDYDSPIPTVVGDIDEIGQVWTNLVQNAIHAMSSGGVLTIGLHVIEGNFVSVSFTDTGCGILKENRDKIFEPFFTTKPLGEGTGLGLDISRKIIERHNGTIEVSGASGGGTVFTVRLPVNRYTA